MSAFAGLPAAATPGNPFASAQAHTLATPAHCRPRCEYDMYGDMKYSHASLVGQPLLDVNRHPFVHHEDPGNANVGYDSSVPSAVQALGARAEFSVAWPPTFPVGGAAEVIELRAAVSLDAAVAAACVVGFDPHTAAGAAATGDGSGDGEGGASWSVTSGAKTAVATAAAGCCSRALAVRDDVIVGDEAVTVDDGGAVRVRLRLQADQPGVTSCFLTGDTGVPSWESLQESAPLMALPQAAREEAHRLLWRMMHEALPPNHSVLPYDPDAFRSPVELLPPRLQAALCWAWSHHFRAFALDFTYLLTCLPPGGGDGHDAAYPTYGTSPKLYDAGFDNVDDPAAADEVSHYQSVLAQMVGFLRDNDMFACLATLLQTAVARGLALVGMDGAYIAASPPPPPQPATATATATAAPPVGGGGAAAAAALSSALASLRAAAAAERAGGGDGGGEAAATDDASEVTLAQWPVDSPRPRCQSDPAATVAAADFGAPAADDDADDAVTDAAAARSAAVRVVHSSTRAPTPAPQAARLLVSKLPQGTAVDLLVLLAAAAAAAAWPLTRLATSSLYDTTAMIAVVWAVAAAATGGGGGIPRVWSTDLGPLLSHVGNRATGEVLPPLHSTTVAAAAAAAVVLCAGSLAARRRCRTNGGGARGLAAGTITVFILYFGGAVLLAVMTWCAAGAAAAAAAAVIAARTEALAAAVAAAVAAAAAAAAAAVAAARARAARGAGLEASSSSRRPVAVQHDA